MSVAFLRNFAAKRLHSIAQCFNPGFVDIQRALKVAPDLGAGVTMITSSSEQTISGAREAVLQKCLVRIAPRDREVGDAFRAHLWALLPRVKTLG